MKQIFTYRIEISLILNHVQLSLIQIMINVNPSSLNTYVLINNENEKFLFCSYITKIKFNYVFLNHKLDKVSYE